MGNAGWRADLMVLTPLLLLCVPEHVCVHLKSIFDAHIFLFQMKVQSNLKPSLRRDYLNGLICLWWPSSQLTHYCYSSDSLINNNSRGRPDLRRPQLWDYKPQHITAAPALQGSVASSVICNLRGRCPSVSLPGRTNIPPTAVPSQRSTDSNADAVVKRLHSWVSGSHEPISHTTWQQNTEYS